MQNKELEKFIDNKLNSKNFTDYAPNGLQVEGRKIVQKIVTGVTASQELLNQSIKQHADAIIVHHGYFWKGESPIIHGMKRKRLKTLLENEINLYSWHLPLDTHPELGNNVQLAKQLSININGEINPLLLWGNLSIPISGSELALRIKKCLGNYPLWYSDTGPKLIKYIAWCTGCGQKFIDNAVDYGVDAFITGEVSEQTIHSARENKLHFYAAGHHNTERGGIIALGEWLIRNSELEVIFIDIPNPI